MVWGGQWGALRFFWSLLWSEILPVPPPPSSSSTRTTATRLARLLPLPPVDPSQVFPLVNTLCFESHFGVCFSEDVN